MNNDLGRKLLLATFIILAIATTYQGAITGFVVQEEQAFITQTINQEFTKSDIINLNLEAKPESILANGKILGDGRVRIYLEQDNKKLLIYDNKPEGLTIITGLVIDNTTNISKNITINITINETINLTENVTINISENITSNITINLTENISVTSNISLNITENISTNITENISEDIIQNVSLNISTNITEPEVLNISEENIAENITENITTIITKNITELYFTNECIETCILTNTKENITITVEVENATLTLYNITYKVQQINITPIQTQNISNFNLTNNTNKTVNQTEAIVSENTSRIEIGKPVKWSKRINASKIDRFELPAKSFNVSSNIDINISIGNEKLTKQEYNKEIRAKIREKTVVEQTTKGTGIGTAEVSKITSLTDKPVIELENINGTIDIEYFTEAPEANEVVISRTKKQVTISSETPYQNVLAYTNITEAPIQKIKLYWIQNGTRTLFTNVTYNDTNKNGLIDRIEWIVPHLSNQTFEIIIEITNAEHLDSNRTFISNIYNEVYKLDNNWSETINATEYVRVTFERNLSSNNDITIYPRTISGEPRIEVYEINGTEIIAEFTTINDNEYNKVFLTNLQGNQDTFDLLILDGAVEFDHIIDPDWFDTNWEFRINITVQASQIGSVLTNFPVYVNLTNLGSSFFSNSNTDCTDLRVTESDATTQTAREVVFCNTTAETGELYFLADSLSNVTNTTFWIYYGNSGASEPAEDSTYGSENTWNVNYLGVYHLQEDVNINAGGYKDSTSNANNGTGVDMTATEVSGKIGTAQDFVPTLDNIDLGDISRWKSMNDTAAGTFTISAWVNPDASSGDMCIVCQSDATNQLLYWLDTSADPGYIAYLAGTYIPVNTNPTGADGAIGPGLNTWEYIVAEYSDALGNAGLYYNGGLDGSRITATFAQGPVNMLIGAVGTGASGAPRAWDGQIDEVRISNASRSADWISAEYTNQNTPTTFYVVGTQGLVPKAPTITSIESLSTQNPTEATTTKVEINFTAEDENGNLNQSTANITFTKNSITRTGTCDNNTINSTATNFNCSVLMQYYDEAGSWTINVSVSDNNNNLTYNDTTSFTYGELYAFTINQKTISIPSNEPGTTNVNASNDPQTLNNTGNMNFSFINITGYQLSNGNSNIGAGNFTINATVDAKGITIGNNKQIPGATLNVSTTTSLYIWVDIPTGLSNGTYTTNTSTQWTIEAYN